MVSQAEHSTCLMVRGPSSLEVPMGGRATSHVSSRTRRYHRGGSHAGGATSQMLQNEFPVFSHSGDVEIVVRVASGHENRYLLHRHTLTRCSGFFEASTSNEWSRAQAVSELPGVAVAMEGADGGNLASAAVEVLRLDDTRARRSSEDCGSRAYAIGLGPPSRRWRYELDTGSGGNDIPMLVQREEGQPNATMAAKLTAQSSIFGGAGPPITTTRGRHHKAASVSTSHHFFRSVANLGSTPHGSQSPPPTQAEEDLLRDYDNLFRIMYNYPPVLDPINIADAYVQCKSLLTLADQYDALAVVGPRIDHHLLQFQSRLWKQIAKYPISYLRLGYLARSRIVFQEALIHVVGQWPAGERALRTSLPDCVLDILEEKVDELAEMAGRVEGRLFRLTLTSRTGERVSPATGYLDWLAVSLFRQWIAENTTPPSPPPKPTPVPPFGAGRRDTSSRDGRTTRRSNSDPHPAAPAPQTPTSIAAARSPSLANLGRTYRTLGLAPPSAFLGHDECKRFLKLTSDLYTRDNLRRFEKRIDELKGLARELVRPLTMSSLELEMGPGRSDVAAAIGYFTCTKVGDRDLPWAE